MEPLQNLDADTALLAQYLQSLADGERSSEGHVRGSRSIRRSGVGAYSGRGPILRRAGKKDSFVRRMQA